MPPLTARERQIIGMIGAGLSNKDIARQLNIGLATTKSHVHNLLGKLNIQRRGQAAAWLREYGVRYGALSPPGLPRRSEPAFSPRPSCLSFKIDSPLVAATAKSPSILQPERVKWRAVRTVMVSLSPLLADIIRRLAQGHMQLDVVATLATRSRC